MGCPVILSDIGALPETIIAPEQDKSPFTGWLVPPGDAAALAAKIRLALNLAPEARTVLGTRACKRVAAKFTLRAMQLATLKVYDDAYAALTQAGAPMQFRDFLMHSPTMFTALGAAPLGEEPCQLPANFIDLGLQRGFRVIAQREVVLIGPDRTSVIAAQGG